VVVRTVLRLRNENDGVLPPELLDFGTDARFPPALVELFGVPMAAEQFPSVRRMSVTGGR
jgi:hypothetical protein